MSVEKGLGNGAVRWSLGAGRAWGLVLPLPGGGPPGHLAPHAHSCFR